MSIRPTGWPIAIWPAVEHGGGQKEELFFHLFDMTVLSSYILLSTCGGKKISHRDFRLTLVREMLARAGHESWPSRAVGRPAPASANIGRMDTRHNKHWPGHDPTKRRCRVCSERGVTWTVRSKCVKCDVALCVDRTCFTIIQRTHSNNYFGPSSVQIAEVLTKM